MRIYSQSPDSRHTSYDAEGEGLGRAVYVNPLVRKSIIAKQGECVLAVVLQRTTGTKSNGHRDFLSTTFVSQFWQV